MKKIYKAKNIFNELLFYHLMSILPLFFWIFIFFYIKFTFVFFLLFLLTGLVMFLNDYRFLRDSSTRIILTDDGIERKGLFGKNISVKWDEIINMYLYIHAWFEAKYVVKTKKGKIHIPEVLEGYEELIKYLKKNKVKEVNRKPKRLLWCLIIFAAVILLALLQHIIELFEKIFLK